MPTGNRLIAWSGVTTLLTIGCFIVSVWTGLAENCNNGVPRWECDEAVDAAANFGMTAGLIATVILFVLGAVLSVAERD